MGNCGRDLEKELVGDRSEGFVEPGENLADETLRSPWDVPAFWAKNVRAKTVDAVNDFRRN